MQRTLEPEVMDTPEEAVSYDAMDHREPNAAFVERLITLGAGGRMLDLGTGPGHIPLLLCERLPEGRVLGVDLAREMLRIADRYREQSPHRDRLAFELADVKALPYPDGAFDTVFSNTILHHLPDPEPFLREAKRVLKPGGVLLIRDLFRPTHEQQLDHLVQAHAGDGTPHQQKMFRDSLHAALTPEELRAMADRVGLNDAELVIDTDRHMSLQRMAAPSR